MVSRITNEILGVEGLSPIGDLDRIYPYTISMI